MDEQTPRRTTKARYARRILVFLAVLMHLFTVRTLKNSIVVRDNFTVHMDASTGVQRTLVDEAQVFQVQDPVDVLFALSGDDTNFLLEFEISLKSVLLNAPLDADLRVHILADDPAYRGIGSVFNRTGITEMRTRKPVSLIVYNVQLLLPKMNARLKTIMDTRGAQEKHTVGTFFRLFANYVLPDDVHHFIYLDTDVIVLANLAELWSHIEPNVFFLWGKDRCAGFMLFNAKTLEEMWTFWQSVDMAENNEKHHDGFNDQSLLRVLQRQLPDKVGELPHHWALSWADGLFKHKKDLLAVRPQAGMLHYNGVSPQRLYKDAWAPVETTWGLGKYYDRLPWSWARFMIESKIFQGDGHPLRLVYNSTSLI